MLIGNANLGGVFDVRHYEFDAQLAKREALELSGFEGRSSRLYNALSQLNERLMTQPVAGVLLLTDGNATDQVMPDQGTRGGIGIPVLSPFDGPTLTAS